ncbi:universal stress protein [Phenylobacterium sp.]|uniref:universal stress protein n=1 Tax=Phenylobacterium sp. TaxID=1871053 RepID=UPI002FDF77A1
MTARRKISEILLASDLGGRCDRATERAAQLARAWGARLTVVVAVEQDDPRTPSWRSAPAARLARAEAELAEVLGGRGIDWRVVVASGRPHDVLLDVADQVGAQFIVTGTARNELLGRSSPGRTVEALMRRAPAPVLVVRRRPLKPYRDLLVPTDCSRAAELALVGAIELLPRTDVALLHGYRVPFAGLVDEAANAPEFETWAQDHLDDFLARVEARTGAAARVRPLVEYGSPASLVAGYARDRDPDLVVLGAHDRHGALGALTPDLAGRLLMACDCDVLLVPEASAPADPPARSELPTA